MIKKKTLLILWIKIYIICLNYCFLTLRTKSFEFMVLLFNVSTKLNPLYIIKTITTMAF